MLSRRDTRFLRGYGGPTLPFDISIKIKWRCCAKILPIIQAMPGVDEYEKNLKLFGFKEAIVWGENADRLRSNLTKHVLRRPAG